MLQRDLTPHPSPPRNSLSSTGEDSTELGSPEAFTANRDISPALSFIKWLMSNVGGSGVAVAKHFRDKEMDHEIPVLDPTARPPGVAALTHPAPCALLETAPKFGFFHSLKVCTAPNSQVFFSPMSNAVFSLTTITHTSPPSIT